MRKNATLWAADEAYHRETLQANGLGKRIEPTAEDAEIIARNARRMERWRAETALARKVRLDANPIAIVSETMDIWKRFTADYLELGGAQ